MISPVAWNLDPAIAHLNHGSFGAVPRTVLEEQRRWASIIESNPTAFFWRRFPEEMARVRRAAAEFVGAASERCVMLPNVTTGFGLILSSLTLAESDQVLVTADTYPGVRAAAERACERAGATLIVAPASNPSRQGHGDALMYRVRSVLPTSTTPLTWRRLSLR